jgi:hypothetical protein
VSIFLFATLLFRRAKQTEAISRADLSACVVDPLRC